MTSGWQSQLACGARLGRITARTLSNNDSTYKALRRSAFDGTTVHARIMTPSGVAILENNYLVVRESITGEYRSSAESAEFELLPCIENTAEVQQVSDGLSVITQSWFEIMLNAIRLPKTKYIPNCDFVG